MNVPRLGRFALHKLIVGSKRSPGTLGVTKAPKKDRAQAGALLRVLLTELPGEITIAWKELSRRGKAWTRAATSSLAQLDQDLVAQLRKNGRQGLSRGIASDFAREFGGGVGRRTWVRSVPWDEERLRDDE